VSKPWTPPRHTAKLRPSRIRRDPLLVPALPEPDKKSQWSSLEWERRFAIAGILFFALAIAVVTMAVSAVTVGFGFGAPPAAAQQFGRCDGSPDCVVDGETLRMAGETVKIAGIYAPQVAGARCVAEQQRGVKALDRLTRMLNSGTVTLGGPVRGADGSWRRTVLVNGRDVAAAMIAAGVARPDDGERHGWCGS
jgi:micrococcal nuclease